MTITLAIAYYHFYFVPLSNANGVFFNRIETSFLFAFTAFLLAHLAYFYPVIRKVCVVLAALFIFNIMHINTSRTGYLGFLFLIPLFSWQIFRWRGLAIGLSLIALLSSQIMVAKFFPDSELIHIENQIINPRIFFTSVQSISEYNQGQTRTSIGYRLMFIKHYPRLIQQAPIFGHGLGSSRGDFSQYQLPDIKPLSWGDPHNFYLQTLYEIGFIGLGLFFLVLLLIWRTRSDMSLPERHILGGLFLVMIIGSGCDNLFYLSSTGHFFVFFVALCLVRPYQLRIQRKQL